MIAPPVGLHRIFASDGVRMRGGCGSVCTVDGMHRLTVRASRIGLLALAATALTACGDPPPEPESIAPPLRPISEASKKAAQDPRFAEYRKLLAEQFAALKRTGEFYRQATGAGGRPMSESDLAQHGALRAESDALAERCFKYADEHFPDESPEVLQQIWDEEQKKAMPEE